MKPSGFSSHSYYKKWSSSLMIIFLFACISTYSHADVKVSNLNDYYFGLYSGIGNFSLDDQICVNTIPVSNYQITFWGDGAGGLFQVNNGVNSLSYEVIFNDSFKLVGGRKVAPNVPLTNMKRSSIDEDCPTGLNGNIQVRFLQADLQAANPGRYQGYLTVTVAPM
ncbi:MAG: hypothetical protein OEY19_12880 [Gammaproteobacteria bacterium]|nr:hypothetical protein [Gammaproteobacteria bacterium]MDH5631208.1 hypothetical protein [Gammaproteobacteria bacterium]